MDGDLRDVEWGQAYWTLARRGGGTRLLSLAGGGTLPVFSSREEAERFLQTRGFGGDWCVRETPPEELASMLVGKGCGVETVVLDPLPREEDRLLNRLVSVGRLRFVSELLSSDEEKTPAGAQLQSARKTA